MRISGALRQHLAAGSASLQSTGLYSSRRLFAHGAIHLSPMPIVCAFLRKLVAWARGGGVNARSGKRRVKLNDGGSLYNPTCEAEF